MELGNNEMTQKIRSAIKAKLVELGSYVDDELPDYIMVMVANKKTQEQMTDDLMLFLGNNTVIFTTWLHDVLENLAKPAADPKPKKTKEHTAKTKKTKEKRSAASLAQKQAKGSATVIKPVKETPAKTASTPTGVVSPPVAKQPAVDPAKSAKQDPSQDIISIKPETNDFLDEELAMATESSTKQSAVISPITKDKTPEQPKKSKPVQRRSLEGSQVPIASHPIVSVKVSPTSHTSRKRKAPGSVISQILNVEEDEDSDEVVSFGKKVASTVLPQRRPSLPLRKQANTFLLKKAVSAAEASTSQVLTAQLAQEQAKIPHKRIKIIRSRKLQPLPPKRNLLLKAVQEAQDSISHCKPQSQHQAQVEIMPKSGLVSRSRILEVTERDYDSQEFLRVSSDSTQQGEEYYADDEEQDETESSDSRKICVASETSPSQVVYVIDDDNTDKRIAEPVYTPTPLAATPSETPPRPVSPKFIVTLEGTTSHTHPGATKQRKAARVAPRLSLTRTIDNSMMYADFVEQQQQLEDELARQKQQEDIVLQKKMLMQEQLQLLLQQQQQQQQEEEQQQQLKQQLAREEASTRLITRKPHMDQVEEMQFEEEQFEEVEEDISPSKKESNARERCMFWPACKNGSDCMYVHPTTTCRTFPKCKFGDKCLFIHPNCKYDSRCSRPNCPYTHATRKQGQSSAFKPPPVALKPVPVYVPPPVSKVCKFHPNCTNNQCSFQHPKMCLFGRGCTRAGCTFTHPQVATGAALKWTKQTHISDRPFAAKETTS